MSGDNPKALDGMTFFEFMAKLDRIIEKNEAELRSAQERLNKLKSKYNA